MSKIKIRITGIEGYYYIEEGYLIYCYSFYNHIGSKKLKDCYLCEVSDLTELTTLQYNELNNKLEKHYNYNLEGRFI